MFSIQLLFLVYILIKVLNNQFVNRDKTNTFINSEQIECTKELIRRTNTTSPKTKRNKREKNRSTK